MYSKEFTQKLLKLDPDKKGKGRRIAILESNATRRSDEQYTKNFIGHTTSDGVEHADRVGALIRFYKPECESFLLPNSRMKKVEGLSVADWILANDIDIVSMSQSNTMLTVEDQNRIAKKCFIITSAGNKDELGETMNVDHARLWWQVAAMRYNEPGYLRDKYGKFQKFNYSSWGQDNVNGATLSEFDTPLGNMGGTSGAAPMYAIQIMEYLETYVSFFKAEPTKSMIIDFIDRHSHNLLLDDEDADLKVGYGMLVMPEKYHFQEIAFSFKKGSNMSGGFAEIKKDGNEEMTELRDRAIIIDGRTYVPMRQAGELFGFDAEWDNLNRLAIFRTQQGDH